MSSREKEQIWVHPKFKQTVKIEASKQGISILELTKEMANNNLRLEDKDEQKKEKKGFLRF